MLNIFTTFYRDLRSVNGSFVNNKKHTGRKRILHNDLVRFGTSGARFKFAEFHMTHAADHIEFDETLFMPEQESTTFASTF